MIVKHIFLDLILQSKVMVPYMKDPNVISSLVAIILVIATLLYAPVAMATDDHDCCDQPLSMEMCHELAAQPVVNTAEHTSAPPTAACDLNCCGMIMSVAISVDARTPLRHQAIASKWLISFISQASLASEEIQPRPPRPLI